MTENHEAYQILNVFSNCSTSDLSCSKKLDAAGFFLPVPSVKIPGTEFAFIVGEMSGNAADGCRETEKTGVSNEKY